MKTVSLIKENLNIAQQYMYKYGYIPGSMGDDYVYLKLLRVYDNGFFTSGGFSSELDIALDKTDDINTMYVSAAAMEVPADWHDWNVFCFNLTDDQYDSGSLSGIDLIKAAQYAAMDNPPVKDADGVFLMNGKKYNACVFLHIIEGK